MLDTLRQVARAVWRECLYSYRGHRRGGRAKELAEEREQHLAKRLDETLDDMEAEGVARMLAEASTHDEKEAARRELMRAIGLPSTPEEERAANDALVRALNAAQLDGETKQALAEIDTKIEGLRGTRLDILNQLSLTAQDVLKDLELEWPRILDLDGRWNRSDPLTAVIQEMGWAARTLYDTIEEERSGARHFDHYKNDLVKAAWENFNASWARMEEYLQRREDNPST